MRKLLDTDPLTDLVVFEFAAALYHEEMNHFSAMTREDLNEDMILGAIRTLTQVTPLLLLLSPPPHIKESEFKS